MASPFSFFRKHQGVMLAVFGVALMIAFVVLPPLLQMMEYTGGGGNQRDVVVTWTGGGLTRDEIAGRLATRRSLLDFLNQIRADAKAKNEAARLDRATPIPSSLSPASVLATMLHAEKARDMGLVVSDDAVTEYLLSVGDHELTLQEIAASREKAKVKFNDTFLFDALREELLAVKLQQMAFSGWVTPPGEAWQYYSRMNRRVTAEFAAFPVADFAAEVDDKPSDKEIRELYEKYKDQVPQSVFRRARLQGARTPAVRLRDGRL